MTFKPLKRVPALIALAVIVFVCVLRILNLSWVDSLEARSYDLRVRQAAKLNPPVATNLGFVFIDEASVRAVRDGSVGFNFGLNWPRQVYARLVDELKEQGATTVALDLIFAELRRDQAPVQDARQTNFLESDEYFTNSMRRAGNVIIAVTKDVTPPPLFLTNAAYAGHIATDTDSDGKLRRAEAYRTYRRWHPAFLQAEAAEGYGVDLNNVRVEKERITLLRSMDEPIVIPLDAEGNFNVADFWGEKLPPGTPRKAKPFTEERAWHMGIVLAASELKLDLDHAETDLKRHQIVLHGENGMQRVIPVDEAGFFYIDWCMPPTDPRLTKEAIESLLAQQLRRLRGETAGLTNRWRGKLVVVGSSALAGNNLTDRGPTPLVKDTLLVSAHWNVANSLLMNRFVRRSPPVLDCLIIVVLGVMAASCMWKMRVLTASAAMVLLSCAWLSVAFVVYVQSRYWLPIVLPIGGAVLINYISLLVWRLLFEQAERKRVIAVFGTVVSPEVMDHLLTAENLSLVGARREISVMFADVRGFTELTDSSQAKAAQFVRENNLTGLAAEQFLDEHAAEILKTVNVYLGVVADTIINQRAVLDKFIGDCVMAFWGAPLPVPGHAGLCVRAAIAAQRAIHALNQERMEENKRREAENTTRAALKLPPRPLLPVLSLGTGINSGMATAGLMGSAAKTKNYTVFGREVNLASRLEGLSGSSRIFISEATHRHLLKDDLALAERCVPQPQQKVKGFAEAVNVFEVPWR